jgi:hypothetical protein
MHQYGLSLAHLDRLVEHRIGGKPLTQQRNRRCRTHCIRQGQSIARVGDRKFGLAALRPHAIGQEKGRDHTCSNRWARCIWPKRFDCPSDFGTEYSWQNEPRETPTGALHCIGECHAGGLDPDKELAWPRRRHRRVDERQSICVADFEQFDRAHLNFARCLWSSAASPLGRAPPYPPLSAATSAWALAMAGFGRTPAEPVARCG